jgi:hypothetical protein
MLASGQFWGVGFCTFLEGNGTLNANTSLEELSTLFFPHPDFLSLLFAFRDKHA